MSSSALLPVYPYRTLESDTTIRILVLHPATSFDAKLEATLIHLDREYLSRETGSPQRYDAVSYCWGDPTPIHSITIDTIWSLGITGNVDTMLRYLRKTHGLRYLWLDAICLNQTDTAEKNVQVQQMGTIYQQASETHIWLGEATVENKIPEIFDVLRAVSTKAAIEKDEGGRIGTELSSGEKTASNSLSKWRSSEGKYGDTLDTTKGKLRLQFKRLLNRPWFERRWILQEAILSKQAYFWCGKWNIDQAQFAEGTLNWLTRIDRTRHYDKLLDWLIKVTEISLLFQIPAIDSVRAICSYNTHPFSKNYQTDILSLLWHFHLCQCFAPHDKIYALLGIATQIPDKVKKVDYNTPWNELFIELATASFTDHPVVMFRHLVSFGSLTQSEPTWPSWVPNWTNKREDMLIPKSYSVRNQAPVPTQWFTEVIVPQVGPITLRTDMAILIPNNVLPVTHFIKTEDQSKAHIRYRLALLYEVLLIYNYTKIYHDQTASGDSRNPDLSHSDKISKEELKKELVNILDIAIEVDPPLDILSGYANNVVYLVETTLGGRKVVSTPDGNHIIIAPGDTEEGDTVTYRPDMPSLWSNLTSDFGEQVDVGFILRPSEIASDIPKYTRPLGEPSSRYLGQYRFVGPCYTLRTWIGNVDPEGPRVTVDIV
jgi:hypothetical protein